MSNSDPKPKKKLKIVAIGAGDPTIKLSLVLLPDSNTSTLSNESVAITVNGTIGANNYHSITNLNINLNTGQKQFLLSSFYAPENNPSTLGDTLPYTSSLLFSSDEFDFELQNGTQLPTNPISGNPQNINEIEFAEIDTLFALNSEIGDSATIILQSIEGNGTQVFLSTGIYQLEALSAMASNYDNGLWQIANISGTSNQYTLFNKEKSEYLAIDESGNFTWSTTVVPGLGYWTFEKYQTDKNIYQIKDNNGRYLTLNSSTGIIGLENLGPGTTIGKWYLHIHH